jgi:exosome complex component RRP40
LLVPGALVYARISSAHPNPPNQDPVIECVNSATGKSDGLGPLKGGMVFSVRPDFTRRCLLKPEKGGVSLLQELSELAIGFEIAVGRNGVIWVNAHNEESVLTLNIGRALEQVDREVLDGIAQKALAEEIAKMSR